MAPQEPTQYFIPTLTQITRKWYSKSQSMRDYLKNLKIFKITIDTQ